MWYREERSVRIQIKGTSSEREREEQRKRRIMKTEKEREECSRGKDSTQSGKTLWGKLGQREDKTHVKHPQAIYCVQLHSFTAQSSLFLSTSESSCWPWTNRDTPLMPCLLLVLPSGIRIPHYCHPTPGQYTQVHGQLLSHGFQN